MLATAVPCARYLTAAVAALVVTTGACDPRGTKHSSQSVAVPSQSPHASPTSASPAITAVLDVRHTPGPTPTPGHPVTPGAFEYNFWNLQDPSTLWDTMDATITVNSISSRQENIYFAIDAWFADKADPFYMGLQPNGTLRDGKQGPMALFSFFGKGATSKHPNCYGSADGGDGVSCHVAYPWVVGRTYLFEIVLIAKDATTETWGGSVTDMSTKTQTDIGWWSIPIAHGLVGSSPQNFTEYYLSVPTCDAVGHGSVTYGAPMGKNGGRRYASIAHGSKLGTCADSDRISATDSSVTLEY